MLYEVKIFDGGGNLLKVVPPEVLEKRSTEQAREMITDRDRQHVLRFEDEAQILEVHSQYVI